MQGVFLCFFSNTFMVDLLPLCISVKSPNYLAIQQASQYVHTSYDKTLLHPSNKTKNSTK